MKLSIITINYNNATGLKNTLDSVAMQTYTEFEHIIVDGASTDGSVDIIRNYSRLPIANRHKITWVSEPDTGIYNAMNKGIVLASGEYILLLNSGDYLVECDVIERIIPELHTDGVIQGGMYLYSNKEECLDYGNGLTEMSFYDVVDGDFLHQADFVRKDVYERYGYYDESYKIGGDTAFFIRTLGFHDISFRCVKIPISLFEGGGKASGKDVKWKQIQMYESKRIEDEILGPRLLKVYKEDRTKVRLYDMLNAHKWSQFLIKVILCLIRLFYYSQK